MRNKNKYVIFITIRSKDPKMVMNFKRILIISQQFYGFILFLQTCPGVFMDVDVYKYVNNIRRKGKNCTFSTVRANARINEIPLRGNL